MTEPILFFIAAIVAVVSALLMIVQRHPVYSALYLVLTFCSLSLLYLLLSAQFIAMVQVIVYAGAIMVLFLFIIFLLNLDRPLETESKLKHQRTMAGVLVAVLFVEVIYLVRRGFAQSALAETSTLSAQELQNFGTIQQVGSRLFDTYFVFAFEVTSLILLIAMIGVVVLAKKRLEPETPTTEPGM